MFYNVSLQLFLVSLAFVFFAKALSGAYMKSSITQIERRFDIPSSLSGVIDGSFEMGMYQLPLTSDYQHNGGQFAYKSNCMLLKLT